MLDQQETKGGGIELYPERVKSLKPRQRQGKENQTRGLRKLKFTKAAEELQLRCTWLLVQVDSQIGDL